MSSFFKNTDLDLSKAEKIVSETLNKCDDGELYLEDTKSESIVLDDNKIKSSNTHGTGCSLASAIASNIGLGNDIKKSIKVSIDYVQNGIKNAPDFGSGNGPIRHF